MTRHVPAHCREVCAGVVGMVAGVVLVIAGLVQLYYFLVVFRGLEMLGI